MEDLYNALIAQRDKEEKLLFKGVFDDYLELIHKVENLQEDNTKLKKEKTLDNYT